MSKNYLHLELSEQAVAVLAAYWATQHSLKAKPKRRKGRRPHARLVRKATTPPPCIADKPDSGGEITEEWGVAMEEMFAARLAEFKCLTSPAL